MNPGYSDVLLGLQYGDEGKARVVDMIAGDYDVIARFNGGANAGHTIETEEGLKVALNQIPSGVFKEKTLLYIGSGCVVDLRTVLREVESLGTLGIVLKGRLVISPQAALVQPHHFLEDAATGGTIGTTRKGIGPAYADRASRMRGERLLHLRAGDLLENSAHVFDEMQANLEAWQAAHPTVVADVNVEEHRSAYARLNEILGSFIAADPAFLEKKVRDGARVLFEGAQSVLLDVVKGYVPYVTSSLTGAGAAYSGGDLSPHHHRKTIGVAKVLMSRVGHGPFVSEFGGAESEAYCMAKNPDNSSVYSRDLEKTYDIDTLLKSSNPLEVGQALRVLSAEYGTVSARPRRVGSLDLPLLKMTAQLNGVDELFLTKCDLLREYSRTASGRMPVTVGYELNGVAIDHVPSTTETYSKVKGIVEEWDGFAEDVSGCRKPAELPAALQEFLNRVGEFTGAHIMGIGVGPKRDQVVVL